MYPGAASRKIRQTQESEEGSSKAPVVTVDLGLDSDTDNSTTNKVNNDANCKISTSEATEIPPQERLRYGSMVREVRHLYKKAMPSGYRSIERKLMQASILPPSPPQYSKPSKVSAHNTRAAKENALTRLETAIGMYVSTKDK